MPTYVLPQVQVFQEFNLSVASTLRPLRACISGGHAALVRYDEADERADGLLGYYDRLIDTAYDWPNRPAGGLIDTTYTKLFINNALLQYFSDAAGSGWTIIKTNTYNNRIKSAALNFAENGDDYPRAATFLDRDVQVGDIAKVRALDSNGDTQTLWT